MIFEPALNEMDESGSDIFGPRSFRDYISDNDIEGNPRTAQYISIDSIERLPNELLSANVMVLRLGSAPNGTGTQFLLINAPEGVSEYFIEDDTLEIDDQIDNFEIQDPEKLLSFGLLPNLSETSLVNLSLASGVLSEVLLLDSSGSLNPPATGRSTFSFELRPHSSMEETFDHRIGQVEIDTMFAERREGELTLFVIEAKAGTNQRSLAKHKLTYPILALADRVDPAVPIVPIYIRCNQVGDSIHFRVTECRLPDPRRRIPGVDELTPVTTTKRTLSLEGISGFSVSK